VSAAFYSIIIVITGGSQRILAEMYALGLVASFTINMGSLLLYRYFTGTKEIRAYHTSRLGTLAIFIILASCLVYLSYTKPYGLALWLTVTVFFLMVGIRVAKHRAPENIQTAMTDNPLQMILNLAEAPQDILDIYFKRPMEGGGEPDPNAAFVSFYSPRVGIPERMAPNHYRFALSGQGLFASITELLYVLKYELPHKQLRIHFGWPLSSWLDRVAIGVMVFSIIRLPKMFPDFTFVMEYFGKKNA
jgi:hypothetical protein